MDLLTAVNRILPKLGEHPVSNLNVRHPTVDLLVKQLNAKVKELTINGWWFNTHKTTLPLTMDKEVLVPSDALTFRADYAVTSIRGGKLHNTTNNTFKWDAPVSGTLITLVPFDVLPESVASYVYYATLVEACITDIGVTQEARAWTLELERAMDQVTAEHLKQMRYTTQRSPRYARYRAALRS